jgi:hypothetical protein
MEAMKYSMFSFGESVSASEASFLLIYFNLKYSLYSV